MCPYTSSYEVRVTAQVSFEQLGFNSMGDMEDFINNYLIPEADKRIDTFCNHSFGTPTFGTWNMNGNGKSILFLPTERCPLLGLSAGSVDSSAVTVANLKVHDEFIEYNNGVFTEGKLNVVLAGSYGYLSLPKDIQNASTQICANTLNDMVRKRVLPDLYHEAAKNPSSASRLVSSTVTFSGEIKEELENGGYVFRDIDIG